MHRVSVKCIDNTYRIVYTQGCTGLILSQALTHMSFFTKVAVSCLPLLMATWTWGQESPLLRMDLATSDVILVTLHMTQPMPHVDITAE